MVSRSSLGHSRPHSSGLDPNSNAYRKAGRCLSIGIRAASRTFPSAVFVLAITQAAWAQNACPVNPQTPENKSKELNIPRYSRHFYRPRVNGDYIVIEYNASQDPTKDPESNKVTWTDYSHLFEPKDQQDKGVTIDQNGSFLPVIYTKEKIAVRVCGLHFTDVLTVTTSPNGLPEQGADIRGAAPITPPPSLSNTLDMLQSGMPTGGTTTQPGLGLGAATALPTLTLSGITQGSVGAEDQTPGKYPSYTPAVLTASGRQVALELFSLSANAKELTRLVERTMGQPYPSERETLTKQAKPATAGTPASQLLQMLSDVVPKKSDNAPQRPTANEPAEKQAPGSVNGVEDYLAGVLTDVKSDGLNLHDSATFDKDMTNIQNLNAQISTLSSALTSQAYASNALTLLNNYSVLAGILDLADLARDHDYCRSIQSTLQPGRLSDDDLKKITPDLLGNLSLSQIKEIIDDGRIDQLPKGSQNDVKSMGAALKFLKVTSPTGDTPLCSLFEQEKVNEFWNSYYLEANYLLNEVAKDTGPAVEENMVCSTPNGSTASVKPPFVSKYEPHAPGTPPNPDGFAKFAGCRMYELNENLNTLREGLRLIDANTTELYNRMNEWYSNSSIEQTDLLAPETSNAYVRLSIVVQRGYTPFTMANAGGAITPTTTLNVPATSGTASTSTPAHAVKTILIEVHRLANFNLMGGVMWIHAPTANYGEQTEQTTQSTSSSGGTPTTTYSETCGTTTITVPASGSYSCLVQTQKSNWQIAGMAGVLWYPFGHDYFPRRSGFLNSGRNQIPSLLFASSITSLGSAAGAVNWEPMNGIDLYGGVGSAHTMVPVSGFTANTIIPTGTTVQTQTQLHWKLTFGVGFDLSVFGQIFGTKGTATAGLP